MAIIEDHKENGRIVYKYRQPDEEILFEKVQSLLDTFGVFVEMHKDIEIGDFEANIVLLTEALVRIDKRRDYFMIFHDDTDMNEIKEAALLAYWILKFKPFSVKNEGVEKKYRQINEAFAVFVIYSVIKEVSERNSDMKFSISKGYNAKIIYAFKFWDLSKEAIMLVAESLCEAAHVSGAKHD